jgi:tRNA(Ile)-lysidine synthase
MLRKKVEITLENRVLQFIRRNGLINSGQKVLVAVSGGPDSVCLLHILYRLRTALDVTLHIAHLDHGLRGAESAGDARYVADLALKLDLPATIEKRDVSGYRSEHHLSPEEAAREIRYGFLAETARKIGAERVAVGHTQDDQVETVLLHIIRGTGTRGLRGLQPCQSLQFAGNRLIVFRPLLDIKRQETDAYCSRNQLSPRLDVSNLSTSLLRNRVRHELLPLLKSYNTGIFDSLLRISRIAQEELAFLDAESKSAFQKTVTQKANTFIFDKEKFLALDPALRRHVLRKSIEGLLGTLKDIEARHIEALMDALVKPAGRQIALPGGLFFIIEYDRYLLGFNPQELTPFPEIKGRYNVRVPGETRIPGWKIEAAVKPRETFEDEKKKTGKRKVSAFSASFDRDRVGGAVEVRARQRGDWFHPLGSVSLKKVGEFMLDARIPRAWRERIPIFSIPQQIIWVAGWRIDERVKVTQDTKQVLSLRMVRIENPNYTPQ